MTNQVWLIVGFVIVFFSAFIGRFLVILIYSEINLASEYEFLMKSFIESVRLSGLLIFGIGATRAILGERN